MAVRAIVSFAEKRAAARVEQKKVVPGTGVKAALDRGAWAVGGGREAGEFRVLPALIGLACLPVVMYLIGSEPGAIFGATSGYSLLLSRGHWLNRRYLQRTETPHG